MKRIPSKEKYRNTPKEQKTEFLREIRRHFHDKDIRETWGMTPKAYYQMLLRFNLSGKKNTPELAQEEDDGDEQEQQPHVVVEQVQVQEEEQQQQTERKVIDAEWTEVGQYTAVYGKVNKEEPPVSELPFPTIRGNTAQLRKQFEAVALFLESHESEDTRFEISITVRR